AIQLYNEKKYKEAIVILNDLLDRNRHSADALFYRGISNLAVDETKKSIHDLEEATGLPKNNNTNAARWYLSLAYLKANKPAKAKKILEVLNNSSPEYKD